MSPPGSDRAARWRLILGQRAEAALRDSQGAEGAELSGELAQIDHCLAAIYEPEVVDERPDEDGVRLAKLGSSRLRLARWLGDLRRYFEDDVVALIQHDAIARRGLRELLFEPETLGAAVPSVELAAMLLSLKGQIPDETLATAREVIRKVVDEITRRLRPRMEQSVRGAITRTRHQARASLANLDWPRTLRKNLGGWQPERGVLIPERLHFFARQARRREWTVIVCLDQSGSMAESVVYGAVMGAILAGIPAIDARVVVFDTEVVDLSESARDATDLLFGLQLGGGTDIYRALTYCQSLVTDPRKTLVALVSDLCEGADPRLTAARAEELTESGVTLLCLLALSDKGAPAFDEELARAMRAHGALCFACAPARLAGVISAALEGRDIEAALRE